MTEELVKVIAISAVCLFVSGSVVWALIICKTLAPQTPEEQRAADNEQARILSEMYREKHNE